MGSLIILSLLIVTVVPALGTDFFAAVHEISSKASTVFKASNSHVARQKRFIAADISGSDEVALSHVDLPASDNCAVNCLQTMDRNLDNAFPNVNITSLKGHSKSIVEEYNPKEFETFCNSYRPGSKCLKDCSDDDTIKKFAQSGLKMVEMMCVTKYDEFKRSLPCMNNVSAEIQAKCDPQCQKFESYFEKLETYGEKDEDAPNLNTAELRELFKGSCLYVKCTVTCGSPITKLRCGKDAADLEKTSLVAAFSSVSDMLASLNNTKANFWPEECRSLGSQ